MERSALPLSHRVVGGMAVGLATISILGGSGTGVVMWGLLAWFVFRRRPEQAATYATTLAIVIAVIVLGATLGSLLSGTVASVLNERYGGAVPVLLVGGGYAAFAWVARLVLRRDRAASIFSDRVRAVQATHHVSAGAPEALIRAPSRTQRLSTFERAWLLAGIAAFVLLVAYPPWRLTNAPLPAQSVGHAWIFTGPDARKVPAAPNAFVGWKSLNDIEFATEQDMQRLDAEIRARSHIDYARLGYLALLVVVMTGGGVAASRLLRRDG